MPPFGYIQSQISSPDKAKGEPRPDPNSKAKPKEDYKQSLAYKVKLIKDADGGLDYLERLTHISKLVFQKSQTN